MGTETERQSTRNFNDNGYQVKLKNPLMGTETKPPLINIENYEGILLN